MRSWERDDLFCWGKNNHGQVGDGSIIDRDEPVIVATLGAGAAAVAGGSEHTCALLETGGVQCWGRNEYGQIGVAGVGDYLTPQDVTGLSSGVDALAADHKISCALTAGGGMKCWGDNRQGQIGDGSIEPKFAPMDVTGLTSGVLKISAGKEHACAVLDSGAVMCWGGNDNGQLGNPEAEAEEHYPINVACGD